LTPLTVFAQADTASAQAKMVASDTIRDSFMDGVSLNHYMNANDNGLERYLVPVNSQESAKSRPLLQRCENGKK
jgi:hypothetical protein